MHKCPVNEQFSGEAFIVCLINGGQSFVDFTAILSKLAECSLKTSFFLIRFFRLSGELYCQGLVSLAIESDPNDNELRSNIENHKI